MFWNTYCNAKFDYYPCDLHYISSHCSLLSPRLHHHAVWIFILYLYCSIITTSFYNFHHWQLVHWLGQCQISVSLFVYATPSCFPSYSTRPYHFAITSILLPPLTDIPLQLNFPLLTFHLLNQHLLVCSFLFSWVIRTYHYLSLTVFMIVRVLSFVLCAFHHFQGTQLIMAQLHG